MKGEGSKEGRKEDVQIGFLPGPVQSRCSGTRDRQKKLLTLADGRSDNDQMIRQRKKKKKENSGHFFREGDDDTVGGRWTVLPTDVVYGRRNNKFVAF